MHATNTGAKRRLCLKELQIMYTRLATTLQHAASHPYYESHWGKGLCSIVRDTVAADSIECFAEVMKKIPLLKREGLENITPFRQDQSPIVSIRHTTGTTTNPLYRYRGTEEAKEINRQKTQTDPKIALHIMQTYHGGTSLLNTGTIDFYCNVLDESSLKNALRLMLERFECLGGKAVEVIYSPWLHMMLLTSWLKDKGVNPCSLEVKKVILFGGHYSPFIDRMLKDYWGEIVEPRYSLSEVAYASAFDSCKGYRLKSTNDCMVQLIPFDGLHYMLAFTELYPVGYNQPVIKYSPEDIVFVEGSHFYVVGRRKNSFYINSKLLLGSNQIRDAIDKSYVPRMRQEYEFHGSNAIYGYPIAVKITQPEATRVHIDFKSDIGLKGKNEIIENLSTVAMKNVAKHIDVTVGTDPYINCYLPK